MSQEVNSTLLEEAQDYITSGDLSGTNLDRALELDIHMNDLDSLWQHILEARDLLRDDEATDVLWKSK